MATAMVGTCASSVPDSAKETAARRRLSSCSVRRRFSTSVARNAPNCAPSAARRWKRRCRSSRQTSRQAAARQREKASRAPRNKTCLHGRLKAQKLLCLFFLPASKFPSAEFLEGQMVNDGDDPIGRIISPGGERLRPRRVPSLRWERDATLERQTAPSKETRLLRTCPVQHPAGKKCAWDRSFDAIRRGWQSTG